MFTLEISNEDVNVILHLLLFAIGEVNTDTLSALLETECYTAVSLNEGLRILLPRG